MQLKKARPCESKATDGSLAKSKKWVCSGPPPTVAVEISHDGHRLIYTSDTGPKWSVEAFGPRADLVLSEATYQHHDIRAPLHLSARQAAEMARAAGARRLMLTHLWPGLDPNVSVAEASDAFGEPVILAAPNLTMQI